MEQALARIEAAAKKIEGAATAPVAVNDEAAAHHARLSREVSEALGELDALIGTLEA